MIHRGPRERLMANQASGQESHAKSINLDPSISLPPRCLFVVWFVVVVVVFAVVVVLSSSLLGSIREIRTHRHKPRALQLDPERRTDAI